MADERIDLPQGTLDLLILRTLALEPQHGWGISERIQQISNNVVVVQQGSLYPALHRLERRGWIKANWAYRKIIAALSITRLRAPAGSNWTRKPELGGSSAQPWHKCW